MDQGLISQLSLPDELRRSGGPSFMRLTWADRKTGGFVIPRQIRKYVSQIFQTLDLYYKYDKNIKVKV